jgi:hypothetical protein
MPVGPFQTLQVKLLHHIGRPQARCNSGIDSAFQIGFQSRLKMVHHRRKRIAIPQNRFAIRPGWIVQITVHGQTSTDPMGHHQGDVILKKQIAGK